jgi:hypothetical protein
MAIHLGEWLLRVGWVNRPTADPEPNDRPLVPELRALAAYV